MTKTVKIVLSRIIAVIAGVSLIATYGCKPKSENVVVADYPVPVEVVDENEEIPETDDGEEVSEKMVDKDLLPEPDSLRETGKYIFNPEIIPDFVLSYYIDDPKVIRIAKRFLNAAYNAEPEVTFDEDEGVTSADVYHAFQVAYLSSPVFDAIDVNPIDDNTYSLTYFAPIVVDGLTEYGTPSYGLGESIEREKAKDEIDAYVQYVTDLINDNLTKDSTDRERAEIIYKLLIKDMKFHLDPENNPYGFHSYSEADIGKVAYERGEAVKSVNNREFYNEARFIRFYSFVLTQLHISVYEIVGRGMFKDDIESYLVRDESNPDEQVGVSAYNGVNNWYWSIVEIDGQNYICDLVLDKLVHDGLYGENSDTIEPELKFFGMSDEKRNETFKTKSSDQMCIFAAGDVMFNANGGASPFAATMGNSSRAVPECPNNLPEE